ncbi:MAG: Scr1 family TA system antitoxin-like transcriptional regulator [Terriglobia bacterium]
MQPGRGKPRRYCSASCKAKGVPSAARRKEYKLRWQRKKRAEEVRRAQQAMRKTLDEHELMAALGKEFPKKSRRQLFHLLKRAQRKRKEVSHGRFP